MTAARTLPVTPAERACATVLRAYLAWNLDHTTAPLTGEHGIMLRLGDFLSEQGLTVEDVGDPTDAGGAPWDLSGSDARIPLRASRGPHWPPRR